MPANGIPSCRVGKSVLVGGIRRRWLLNERMPLFFGVKYGHMKLWIPVCTENLIRVADVMESPKLAE